MEAGQDEAPAAAQQRPQPQPQQQPQQASAPSTPSLPAARQRSSSDPTSVGSPTADGPEGRAADHDSLVTVRLSEPPPAAAVADLGALGGGGGKSPFGHAYTPSDAMAETVHEEEDDDGAAGPAEGNAKNLQDELQDTESGPEGENTGEGEDTGLQDVEDSSDDEEVDWDELQKSEDKVSKDRESDKSTAMLLARLEQENNKLATNPKSVKVRVVAQEPSARRPRPPSMAQLREMVRGPQPSRLRYSMLPAPPMTELEFYAALVKDYQQTAARLPTLLSNKIRKGIPPPLRGVVWQSMARARDAALEEQFERLSGESSPYEGIIGRDLGRSFPGVDMFREADGEGQRMLGRVLKCYSLYDQKIGYCQGLAFLVGPLLMHMTDKQAFCVLVRLMEDYDLRNSFLPDLAGLHVRIYQFRELLKLHLPGLSAHMEELQVDPAYVSQWFLSFFGVTCPLPMLFRIYDVVFAEGAPETIMRVALSLMHKNQARILACTEMEDVMQLLLSRGLWDCYHYNADEFVQDFAGLSGVVTRERLQSLEQGYRESQIATSASSNEVRASAVSTAASRFLGRLWFNSSNNNTNSSSSSSSSPKPSPSPSSTLSPGLTAPSRPLSMLRRSASKQSIASTLNSMEAASSSASSILSTASTDATSLSRDSSSNTDDSASTRESTPVPKPAPAAGGGGGRVHSDARHLHTQIEDLLTALSELQRQHALLANQLQREREERDEDRKAVRSLLDGLRKKASSETVTTAHSGDSQETIMPADGGGAAAREEQEREEQEQEDDEKDGEEDEEGSTRPPPTPEEAKRGDGHDPAAARLSELVGAVEERFAAARTDPRSSIPQTKTQLRDELARAKEQLSHELSRTQEGNRRALELENEVASLKEQLRESHAHVRNLHQDKQRLERQIHGMRVRASEGSAPVGGAGAGSDLSAGGPDGWFARAATAPAGGLRELKLGRSKSTPSGPSGAFGKRSSSLGIPRTNTSPASSSSSLSSSPGSSSPPPPASEFESLLLELVQAKTAEAVAKQEAEEAKQRLETLRKALGLAPGDLPHHHHHHPPQHAAAPAAAASAAAAVSGFGGMFSRFATSASFGSGEAAAATGAGAGAGTASTPAAASASATTSTAAAGGTASGGFWGWKR